MSRAIIPEAIIPCASYPCCYGSISVGKTETVDGPADVKNSGTNKHIILDFKIPRGGATSGTTDQRPTTVAIGSCYFDITLGIPIWYNGENWIDATGTVV